MVYCEVEVYVGAKPEPVVFAFGSGINPASLITAERPFAVIVSDYVLTELRADELKQKSEVSKDRPCAENRMVLLSQVPDNKPDEESCKNDDDPKGCTHAKPRYQRQLQWSKDLQLRTDATCLSYQLLALVNTLPLANLLLCD